MVTYRVNLCVDENDYPWVVWIDDDGDNQTLGIVYIESSSTKNGVWTQAVSANFTDNITSPITHAWFTSIMPINNTGTIVELEWSSEGFDADADKDALVAVTYNGTWSAIDTVVAMGSMNHARPDAFSFYDHGSAAWVTYTNEDGSVYARARSSIQTWVACAAAEVIKEDGVTLRIPTLSGYAVHPSLAGENLLCIVHDNDNLWYSIHTFGAATGTWGAWQDIWSTSASPTDNITRHVAAYKYSSPLGFAWQTTSLAGVDTVYYWWLENTNNTLGYYTSTSEGNAGFTFMHTVFLLVLAAASIWILLITVFKDEEDVTKQILAIIAGAIVIMLVYFVASAILHAFV